MISWIIDGSILQNPGSAPRNTRRYGQAPNGAMAAAIPQNLQINPRNPRNYGRRPRPVRGNMYNSITGQVYPANPRNVIMDNIEYEHNYAREGEEYRDGMSLLVEGFKTQITEEYRVSLNRSNSNEIDQVIRQWFRDNQGNYDTNINQLFDSLLSTIRRTHNLGLESNQRTFEYLSQSTINQRTEMLNDLKMIMNNFKNTIAQNERNRNGRRANITGGKSRRGKRKSRRTRNRRR